MSLASRVIKKINEAVSNDMVLAKDHDMIDWNAMLGQTVRLKDGRKFIIARVYEEPNPDGSTKIGGQEPHGETYDIISSRDIGGY